MEDQSTPADLLPISVWVAGRSYRLRVPAADESLVRQAVKRANQQIADLRQHYAGRDDQDFIAMALLMYATDRSRSTAASADDAVEDMISRIDKALGE